MVSNTRRRAAVSAGVGGEPGEAITVDLEY
jgi:hypothetical protein